MKNKHWKQARRRHKGRIMRRRAIMASILKSAKAFKRLSEAADGAAKKTAEVCESTLFEWKSIPSHRLKVSQQYTAHQAVCGPSHITEPA